MLFFVASSGGEVTLHRVKGSVSFIGSGQNGIVTKSQDVDVSHGFFFVGMNIKINLFDKFNS